MDTSKYLVKETSYQDIYESFLNLFPEWKQSVKNWVKDGFAPVRRTVLITMKNGIQIRFGCYKEEDGEWTWAGYIVPSQKTKDKLGPRYVKR